MRTMKALVCFVLGIFVAAPRTANAAILIQPAQTKPTVTFLPGGTWIVQYDPWNTTADSGTAAFACRLPTALTPTVTSVQLVKSCNSNLACVQGVQIPISNFGAWTAEAGPFPVAAAAGAANNNGVAIPGQPWHGFTSAAAGGVINFPNADFRVEGNCPSGVCTPGFKIAMAHFFCAARNPAYSGDLVGGNMMEDDSLTDKQGFAECPAYTSWGAALMVLLICTASAKIFVRRLRPIA